MVLDTSLLNTRQYKVHIEGKVEQSRERSCALPYTSVQLLKREPSGRPRLRSPTSTNNSIKRQSYVYTQLIDQAVLFQTIQFSISHLFALSLNARVRVDLEAMAMKGYDAFPRASDCFMLYPGQSWGGYLSVEMHLVYSTAPAECYN